MTYRCRTVARLTPWYASPLQFETPPPNHNPPKQPPRPLSFISLRPSLQAAELWKLLEDNQKATLTLVVFRLLLFALTVCSYLDVHKTDTAARNIFELIYEPMNYKSVL